MRQYIAEVIVGLEQFAVEELKQHLNKKGSLRIQYIDKGEIAFETDASLKTIHLLRSVQSISRRLTLDVPRPKALLGNQQMGWILEDAQEILKEGRGSFKTLSIAAAGSESSVMQRIKQELSQRLSLQPAEIGDFVVRIRPNPSNRGGWQVLMRITPRPLATRTWRNQNFEGALNATIAYTMIQILFKTGAKGNILNLGSGSGTFLAEFGTSSTANEIWGLEIDPLLIDLSRKNLTHKQQTRLIQGDFRKIPLGSGSIDALISDLPFGQKVGTHQENLKLYPKILEEAYRVSRVSGKFLFITHEIKLISTLLRENDSWYLEAEYPVVQRGLHPHIYLLGKND